MRDNVIFDSGSPLCYQYLLQNIDKITAHSTFRFKCQLWLTDKMTRLLGSISYQDNSYQGNWFLFAR